MRLARRSAGIVLVLAAWLASASLAVSGQPLRFRRLFAPADRPELWPRDSDRYVPMEAAEFEELVELLRGVPPGMPDLGRARLVHAEYEGRLVEPDLLQGRAILQFEHDGGEPVLARLDGWEICLASAAWEEIDGPPALIGAGPDQTPLLLVERSGRLVASWTLRGQIEGEGAVSFPLALARTAVSSLALELPIPLAPAFSAGISREVPAVAEGWRRWRVDLGGTRSLRVLVAGSQAQPHQRRLTLVEEQTTYDVSPLGVDVLSQFTLDVHHEPLERLSLSLDPGLELVAVRYADVPLAWKLDEQAEPLVRRALVELPEPVLGTGRVLRVAAVAPVAMDQRWRLPRVRVEQAIWQAGRMHVLVRAPLEASELEPVMCRQSGAGPLAGGIAGEMFELDAFSPDAAVELAVARPPRLPSVHAAAVVSVAPDELQQQVQLWLSWNSARPRTVELQVAPGWLIEDVAGTPPEAWGQWEFVPQPNAGGLLRLPLAVGQEAGAAVSLTVKGRRPRAAGEDVIAGQALEMLRFSQVRPATSYLLLRSLGPYELHREPEELNEAVDRTQLPEEVALLFQGVQGLPVRLAARATPWQVRLVPHPPRYRARIHLETHVRGDEMLEHARLYCQPGKSPLDRVLVHFTQRSPTAPQWTIDVRRGQTFTVRRLSDEETLALAVNPQGETWEVSLEPPRDGPLQIQARRRLPRASTASLALVSAPQAEDQQGLLIIRSSPAQPLRIENTRLAPAMLPTHDESVDLCAALRYDPARESAPGLQAAVRIHALDPSSQPARTYVSDLRVDSFAESSGRTRHRLAAMIRSGGHTSCSLMLPQGARVLSVRTNGQLVRSARDGQKLSVPLDPGRRWQRLAVEYETAGPTVRLMSRWQASWPVFDLPVAQRSWTLWLPPALVCVRPSMALQLSPSVWLPRLFGGLARGEGEAFFHPLSLASWRAAVVAAIERLSSGGVEAEVPASPYRGWRATLLAVEVGARGRELEAALAEGGEAGVWLAWRAARELANLSAMLAALALVRWQAGRRGWFAGWLAVLVAAAIALPQGLHSVAACATQGTLLALAWNVARPRRAAVRRQATLRQEGSTPGVRAARAGVLGLLMAVLVSAANAGQPPAAPRHVANAAEGTAGGLQADEGRLPAAAAAKAGPRVYQVLIPVDEQRRPTGDRYLVPEEFRNLLRERAMEARGTPRAWMLQEALYTGTLARDAGQGSLRPAGFVARLSVRVFTAGARLAIPFGEGGTAVQAALATLDGNPIDAQWDAEVRVLRTEPLEAGEHVLELPLALQVQSLGLRDGMLISCPRLCRSKVELSLPADAEDVLVPEARGAQGRSADGRRLWAELGPVNEFSLRWRSQAPAPAQAPVSLEQLVWLNLQPGSVAAKVRLHFELQPRQLDRIRLLVDQRLRMLPVEAPAGAVPTMRMLPREPRLPRDMELLELVFPQPVGGKFTLTLPFLVVGAVGTGNVRLPRIEVADAVTNRLWVGVDVDDALEYTLPDAELARPVNGTDFAAAWGAEAPQLDFAVELAPRRPVVSVATRRRSATTAAEQQLAFVFGPSGTAVEYRAQLETVGGVAFQHYLDLPGEFQVETVDLRVDGRAAAVRWARTSTAGIAIFLREPAGGKQELTVQGWLPAQQGSKFLLSGFGLRGAETRRTTVHLRRESAVLVSPLEPVKATEIVPLAEGGTLRGWPVKSYVTEGGMPDLAVEVLPNQLQVQAVQLCWVERSADAWMLHVEIRAEVREGQLDQIRLEIPPHWQGPFEVLSASGEAAGQAVLRTTATRSILHVLLRNSMSAMAGIHLRGTWQPPASEPVVLPQIVMLDAAVLERFVLLPQRLGSEPAVWLTERLQPDTLPQGLPLVPPAGSFEAFRVLAEPFRAELRREPPPAHRPRVRHAETLLTWFENGTWIGRSIFDVEPAGATGILLDVPPHIALLHCTVDGLDAALLPKTPTRWELPLAPQPLPVRVELAFTYQPPAASVWQSERVLASPRPVNVPAGQWLWAIATPREAIPPSPLGWQPLSNPDLERQRLRDLATLLRDAAETLTRQDSEDAEGWYRTWAGRLREGQLRLLQWATAQEASQRSPISEEVARSVREQDAIALRLNVQHVWQQIKDRTRLPPRWQQSSESWGPAAIASQAALAWQAVGETSSPELTVRVPRRLRAAWQPAVALNCLLIVGAYLAARRVPPDWCWRWSRLLLVAAGLGWWLWLRPPQLGLLICLLALLAGILPAWRRAREPGSTLQVVAD
ncbi:MAG: hypothetical protein K6T86_00790 [Pirellulales bacterium]|nr:hypothetical protein [Pirellulales bacterium]